MNLQPPQVVFLVGLTAYLGTRMVYQRRASGTQSTVQRSTTLDRLLVIGVVLGQILLPLMYVFTPALAAFDYRSSAPAAWIGALAWIAGLWLFWRSHVDLGRNWSVSLELRADHRLVTHGVYRTIRHPMYSSFLLFGLAQALLLPNWIAGPAALVAVLVMCIIRLPHEEAMMLEHFGDEYREYSRRTGRLLPRLTRR